MIHGPITGGTQNSGSISRTYNTRVPDPSGSSRQWARWYFRLLRSGIAVAMISELGVVSRRSTRSTSVQKNNTQPRASV